MTEQAEIFPQVILLTSEWQLALRVKARLADTPEWALADKWESDAYDRLVDYVEAHELNYTKWDPRGPEEPES